MLCRNELLFKLYLRQSYIDFSVFFFLFFFVLFCFGFAGKGCIFGSSSIDNILLGLLFIQELSKTEVNEIQNSQGLFTCLKENLTSKEAELKEYSKKKKKNKKNNN